MKCVGVEIVRPPEVSSLERHKGHARLERADHRRGWPPHNAGGRENQVSQFWRGTIRYRLLYAIVSFPLCIVRAIIVLLEVMSASGPFLASCLGQPIQIAPGKEADPWNLPLPFSICYSNSPPFSRRLRFRPSGNCKGWVLSHRHRYITEVIFSGGNVGNGHWSRFHRFFSDAAWDLDIFTLCLAKLVGSIWPRVPLVVGRR